MDTLGGKGLRAFSNWSFLDICIIIWNLLIKVIIHSQAFFLLLFPRPTICRRSTAVDSLSRGYNQPHTRSSVKWHLKSWAIAHEGTCILNLQKAKKFPYTAKQAHDNPFSPLCWKSVEASLPCALAWNSNKNTESVMKLRIMTMDSNGTLGLTSNFAPNIELLTFWYDLSIFKLL